MLGNNILKLRKHLGLSQEELSEQVNVTRQTISNWELNETQPNPEQLKLLSKALNVSVDELINNEIKSVIEKKIDNTAKYSKILIKLVIIICVMVFLLGLFNVFYSLKHRNQEVNSIRLNCKLDNENYIIDIRDNNYYKCINCSQELEQRVEEYFESNDLDTSIKNIKFYFKEHNGVCE